MEDEQKVQQFRLVRIQKCNQFTAKQVLDNFSDREWLGEQLEITKEFPKEKIWEDVLQKLRARNRYKDDDAIGCY